MRAALPLLIPLLLGAPAQAQENIIGPCRDGYRWMATAVGGQPVAAFATCQDARPLIVVACFGGQTELRVAAAAGTALPAPGERATGTLSVDGGAPIELRMAPGQPGPDGSAVIRILLTNGAIDAMAAGFRARLDLRGTGLDMHLGASGDVLNLMARRC